jgi:hypothetical protein
MSAQALPVIRRAPGRITTVATALGAALVALGVTTVVAERHFALSLLIAGVAAVGIWLVASERYELTLIVVLLYIGLLDGYLKLRVGGDAFTLARDVLLYAIVAGAFARWVVRKEAFRLPPLSGWVIAWIAVVLVQLLNPDNGTWSHSFQALRPHLEFVPLFFLGYQVMRTSRRMRAFILLLLVVTAVNAVVAFIQLQLTPDELAQWGPGYAERVNATGDVEGRYFVDEQGEVRTRPFGLGSDIGFGGALALLAAPGALALIALSAGRLRGLVALPLAAGVVVAAVTSQARFAVVGSVLAVVAYLLLGALSRRRIASVGSVAVGLGICVVGVSLIVGNSEQGQFDRYDDIAPSQVLSTSYEYRRDTLGAIPDYATSYPLGAGIGSVGPAGGLSGRPEGPRLNGESEMTTLIVEVGVPGFIVMLGFNLVLLAAAISRIRRIPDREVQLLLAALAAPLFALFATWYVGPTTVGAPGAPYMWFIGGTLAYWLFEAHRAGRARAP